MNKKHTSVTISAIIVALCQYYSQAVCKRESSLEARVTLEYLGHHVDALSIDSAA